MNRFWYTTKTTLLLAGLTGFLVLIGGMLGGTTGMMFALVLAVRLNMAAWWFSDKVALRMSGTHEVTPEQAPRPPPHGGGAGRSSRNPKPHVYLIDGEAPNAFATGRSPAKGAMAAPPHHPCIEPGRTRRHDRAELAHIKNRDTLISEHRRLHRGRDGHAGRHGPLGHDLRRRR